MPLVQTVRIDSNRLYELAKERYGTVIGLAREIDRLPKSIWNLRVNPVASVRFATQMATALGVQVADITLPAEPEQPEAADKPEAA